MIETNIQKQKDFEIPLFKLEQRVEKLENQFATYQTETIASLTQPVADLFNTKLKTYLPTVDKAI